MIEDLTIIIGGYLLCYLIFSIKRTKVMENNFKNGFIKYGLKHGYIKPRKKKIIVKTDYFVNCRCCGEYIRVILGLILTKDIAKIAFNDTTITE